LIAGEMAFIFKNLKSKLYAKLNEQILLNFLAKSSRLIYVF